MRIEEALQALRPAAEWVLRGDTYDDIEWLDNVQTKPSQEDVTAKMAEELLDTKAALLARLGITEEEAALLLGGN
jgi:hypothetical protein